MTFAESLKKLRHDNSLTQSELAEKLYISRQSISKWELNKSYPDIDKLILLSKIFDISIDELLGQDKLLRKDIIMKSTLYRKSISILKYLGLLVATILLFLGLNFWSNQLDDLHIQDVKIYNTFFAMENGKPTF
ncbi:helix-turn-helix domain-containing protein, partial [Lactiplantibacillus pentosus]